MFNKALISTMTMAAALLSSGNWPAASSLVSKLDQLAALHTVAAQPTNTPELESQRGEVTEEFHQNYPLAPNGRLSLDNINGDVKITVSDGVEVQVNAVKRAYNRERLAEAKIEITNTADSLRIRTIYPDRDQTFTNDERGHYNNPATVDYSIVVPRQARIDGINLINGSLDVDGVAGDVRASSVNGRVSARGLKGEAKLSTVNGTVEAVFEQLDPSKTLALASVNGNITVVIPSDSNAVVRAETVHGSIRNDFGLAVEDGEYVGHSLYGQLGSGGSRIKLGNVNGGINIKRAGDGRPVSSVQSLSKENEKKEKFGDDVLTADEREAIRERARADAEKIRQQITPEVQREVEQAMRDAEREIQRAQREVQRETQRQMREEARSQSHTETRTMRSMTVSTGERYVDKESKTFTVPANARINVSTYDGPITVHGWDKSEVMYNAVKHGEDAEQLKEVVVDSRQDGPAISIIAKSTDDGGWVGLELWVPRNANVYASSEDGALMLEGVSGELTLRTSDGGIEVSDSQGQLKTNTGDGHIRVANFQGQADVRTGDGAISLDGRFSGLSAHTGDGAISLAVAPDSNFTIETDATGITNQGLTISEDPAPSGRTKRWKIGRGGTVFGLFTGEGRLVLRPR
ncbi:MAG TPA: DUF4097 family beta strand repeat-containing protein [Pyrinomonadaceae bacterium]|nr:DUF4097 family beta strand repeat-containing protein [Pyrinomonadaceae bacterium]